MFKFSFNWLKDYCSQNIKFDDTLSILNLQGFEFQGHKKVGNDIITAIEVKANRPDMLSHMGIARELKAYAGENIPKLPVCSVAVDNSKFPVKIKVDENVCKRYCGITLHNVDVNVATPAYMKERLEALGINSINAVVDIANYVMLDIGQPLHTYDADKISGNCLKIAKADSDYTVNVLGNQQTKISTGDIIICDDSQIQCVAGIVGAEASSVTENTKNIFVEAAIFDEICVRLTSRRMKISTPSSFRFERGVNASATLDALLYFAKMVTEICGGEVGNIAFDFNKTESNEVLKFSVKSCNNLLGLDLTSNEIAKYFEKYNFACNVKNDDLILVTVPDYRLDVKKEVDLIEEVARIHGYDNIESAMPQITASYHKNSVWSKMDEIRKVLIGLGFSETINYSFIDENAMKTLDIGEDSRLYSNIKLQNPISGMYALMRPTLLYSLVDCLAYNQSIGNSNLNIFELGRVYFKDESQDTKCKEIDTCAFLMSGVKIPRGWGIAKDIKYTYYDLLEYVNIIFKNFGQKFELKPMSYGFCEEGSGYEIIAGNKAIGFICEVNKSQLKKIQNLKLVKDKVFYCEFYVDDIKPQIKKIEFESKYPPVNRLYNFVQDKSVKAEDVIKIIKSASDVVISVTVKDIYSDKTFLDSEHAVLYEVRYCSKTETLTLEQIEKIEQKFLSDLSQKNIKFKN